MEKVFKQILLGIIIVILSTIITFILRENFFKFDKPLTKENKQYIEQYISDINNSNLKEGMTFLSTYYFGDRFNNDKIEVYLYVLYDEYMETDTSFSSYKNVATPYVVVIDTSNDNFTITDYQIPNNTKEYQKLFPLSLNRKIKNFSKDKEYEKLLEKHQELITTYREYFKEQKGL